MPQLMALLHDGQPLVCRAASKALHSILADAPSLALYPAIVHAAAGEL